MNLSKVVAKKICNYSSEKSLGFKLRLKRAHQLEKMIGEIYTERGSVRVLDVGGTIKYWDIFSDEIFKKNNISVTIINLECSEKCEKDHFVVAEGNGCKLNYKDKSFDIVHSNSVIEHVGSWENMLRFSSEIERVGKRFFVQTPNYFFPIEPHFMVPFFHWLPRNLRLSFIQKADLGNVKRAITYEDAIQLIDGINLLSHSKLKKLFPNAKIIKEKIIGITKSFVVVDK